MKPHTPAASLFPDQYVSPFLSDVAVRLIKTYTVARTEIGLGRFASYKTEHGEWRIGYGSKRIGKVWAGPHFKTTQKEVDAQLIRDLEDFCVDFSSYVYMPLNVKKRAAIVGYAHSVGLIAFKQSNLLKLINERATRNAIIKEWSPFINPEYRYVNSLLKRRRRVELNLYLAPDAEVPLFTKHKCPLKQCLLNLGESYMGTPNQIKAIEYLERKLLEWDPSEETLRRFWRYWNQEQGGLGSPRSL